MAKKKKSSSKKKKTTSKEKKTGKKTVKSGSKIKFHYTGKLKTGELFDKSEGRGPLEVEIGKGMIIPGLEEGISGMKEGEKKEITVEAKDAYGAPRDDMIKEIPKGPIPDDVKLEPGTMLYLRTQQGQPFPAKILEVKDDTVVLDLNHPLAGKDLIFEIEIVEIA